MRQSIRSQTSTVTRFYRHKSIEFGVYHATGCPFETLATTNSSSACSEYVNKCRLYILNMLGAGGGGYMTI